MPRIPQSPQAHYDAIGQSVSVRFPVELLSRRDQVALLQSLMEQTGVSDALMKDENALNAVFNALTAYQSKA